MFTVSNIGRECANVTPTVINPRRACAKRVTVLAWCVCVRVKSLEF